MTGVGAEATAFAQARSTKPICLRSFVYAPRRPLMPRHSSTRRVVRALTRLPRVSSACGCWSGSAGAAMSRRTVSCPVLALHAAGPGLGTRTCSRAALAEEATTWRGSVRRRVC